MKKLIIVTGFMLFFNASKAQPPGPPPPPGVEERLQRSEDLLKEIKISDAQQQEIKAALKIFFQAEDKLRKDNPPPPPPPPDPKVKAAMDKIITERDEKIKKILTEDQFNKFKEAEKKLHPPKPGENGKPGQPPPNH